MKKHMKKTKRVKPQRGRPASVLHGTVDAWATALGRERQTLVRSMVKAGVEIVPHKHYSPSEILLAVFGDDYVETVRGKKLDNDAKERKAREEDEDWMRIDEVEKLLTDSVVGPLRQALTSVDTTLDVRCNSDHPEVARAALRQWSEEVLKLCKDGLTIKKGKTK